MAWRCSMRTTMVCSMCFCQTARPWTETALARHRRVTCTATLEICASTMSRRRLVSAKWDGVRGCASATTTATATATCSSPTTARACSTAIAETGTFEDATNAAGLKTGRTRWDTGCTFVDYDRDGRLDLASRTTSSSTNECPKPAVALLPLERGGWRVMLRPERAAVRAQLPVPQRRRRRVQNVSAAAYRPHHGLLRLAIVASDFDNDDYPESICGMRLHPKRAVSHQKNGTFNEIGLLAGWR